MSDGFLHSNIADSSLGANDKDSSGNGGGLHTQASMNITDTSFVNIPEGGGTGNAATNGDGGETPSNPDGGTPTLTVVTILIEYMRAISWTAVV